MANGTTQRVADLLSAPMEAVITSLGVGIARAQRELDRNAIATQREIDEDPALAELGLQATWYQMPRVELELTMAIAMEEKAPVKATAAAAISPISSAVISPGALVNSRLAQLHIQPVNATYNNQFNYNVNASSKMKLTIVPVPPPAADAVVVAKLKNDEVLAIAQPQLVSDANARLAVNFNGQGRLWFVMQYKITGDQTQRLALVVIDDDTKQIVKQVK